MSAPRVLQGAPPGGMRAALAALAWFAASLPAYAGGASDAASPAPGASAAATPSAGLAGAIWDGFNAWAIYLEDIVFSLWPSTPTALKLSTLMGPLLTEFPDAPWFILHDFLVATPLVFLAIGVVKALEIFWP